MRLTPLEEKIARIIEPTVTGLGYDLVAVQESGEGGGLTLQIMAENPKTRGLGIDDCTKLNRAIGTLLEVEDPIAGAYRLEISSPGIDRLLVRKSDFADYVGFDVKIEIDPPMEGQKRFRGHIVQVEGNDILLKTDTGQVALPFSAIQKAKLVMSAELIKETQKRVQALNALNTAEKEGEDHGTAASR